MASPFEPMSNRDVVDLIEAYPLAWVVNHGSGGFGATSLPLLADVDETGAVVRLEGHMARANPQVAGLKASPRVALLFQGPNGYVSPSWLSDRDCAPTWIYASVHIEAVLSFQPDQSDAALERLTRVMEAGRPNGWSIAELGDRYHGLRDRIIAFRADVVSVRGRFKLGQDEPEGVVAEVAANIGDAALDRWIRRFNPRLDLA